MTNEKTAKEKESRYQINQLEAGGGEGREGKAGGNSTRKKKKKKKSLVIVLVRVKC